ncbi:hypothetical protein M3Y98_00929300 [Aphelenchoides besseyi]|nr:hypothetical protein M3Y98_00929300 [Aphelenchoides besseyi]KAI6194219.1 hypothetical protein M3Y96_01101600 [Aphelenchoides besseyi]
MATDSNVRVRLIAVLLVWLTFTAARLAFDLIGRLWLAVIFNLAQLLADISGLFGASIRRRSLLFALSATSILSVIWNAALFVYYSGVIGENKWLSAGLPHGYSFFVRHTPFCVAYFNVTTGCWAQESPCPLGYDVVERIQATVHIFLAVLTTFFAILLARRRLGAKSPVILPPPIQSSGFLNIPCEDPRVSTTLKNSTRSTTKELKVSDVRDDFSSAATAELNSDSGSSAEVKKTKANENLQRSKATPPIAHSRCRSEHRNPPKPPRDGFDSDDYVAARLATHETVASFPAHPKQTSACRSRSLISFDPKSANLIRRVSHDDSDDEIEDQNYSELPGDFLQSNISAPSQRAPIPPFVPPIPMQLDLSSAILPHHSKNLSVISDSGVPSTCTQSNGSPDLSQVGVPLTTPIYEHVRGRLDCSTAFPVLTHAKQHAYAGVSISTAIPLHRTPRDHFNGYERLNQQRFPTSFHRRHSSDRSQEVELPPPLSDIAFQVSKPLATTKPPDLEGLLV